MLIECHRHRPADLELWRELERADLAHGRSKALAKLAARAIKSVITFAEKGLCYCSVSWGKDSVVVADLVLRASRIAGLSIPLVWVRVEPISNPHCLDVRDSFLAAHSCDYHEVRSDCRIDANGAHATGTLERGFAEVAQRLGTRRRITGVRADESGVRTISARSHGVSTAVATRPLLWWQAKDVFGWLAAKSLPVHPNYAMLGGGLWERERIRVASLTGKRGAGMGRAEWEREYYGDILRRIDAGNFTEAKA